MPEIFATCIVSVAQFSQQLSVLKKMAFCQKSISELSPVGDKLYVLGHGEAGVNFLAVDKAVSLGCLTAKMLAKQMSPDYPQHSEMCG